MAGIYIHIPFCKRRCGYCDFFSCTSLDMKSKVLDAISLELSVRSGFLSGEPVHTIYAGGGTPSVCTPVELGALVDKIKSVYDCSDLREVTLEANPDDLNGDYLSGLLSAGFNRISIGVQSFIDRDLRLMNRRHDSAAAIRAVRQAREAGFGNITIDLIYGIPGMSDEEWRHNVRTALDLGVEHISAYHLSIEEGTPFDAMARGGRLTEVGQEQSVGQYEILCRMMAGGGYEHYEISNFARDGFVSLHNSNYWSGVPYLGVGPSAHSFAGNVRRWNHPSIGDYLGADAFSSEELDSRDRYNETVMLSLRTSSGLDPEEIGRKFGAEAMRKFLKKLTAELAAGNIEQRCGRVRIPERQFLIADVIISRFFEV